MDKLCKCGHEKEAHIGCVKDGELVYPYETPCTEPDCDCLEFREVS